MELQLLSRIEPEEASLFLTPKTGIYFWFNKETNELVYIGIAVGVGGLKKRIVSQHLNPTYLEYRPQKHTGRDKFQLKHSISRASKDKKTMRQGIDKSAFRKSIGRKIELKPGAETVKYIIDNLYLKIYESENISLIKEIEVALIKKYEPIFNTAHRQRNA